jgi:hypothetical protein
MFGHPSGIVCLDCLEHKTAKTDQAIEAADAEASDAA